jgi:hypothetical protein
MSSPEGTLVSKVFPIPFGPDAATSSPVAATLTLLRKAGIVLEGSALVAVCAHIALPLYFTPVPLTLQTLAVLLLGLLLSPRMAAGTLGVYLAEGALASKAIGERTEKYGAERTERQRDGDGPNNGVLVYMEVSGQVVNKKDKDKEIERIENPSENPR